MAEKPRILIVDDEAIVIRSAERVLKAEGYDVEGVLGGREAIIKIEQNSYDLVFTDLKMPEVDGITLIRWIKKTKPSIGIVIITGYPSQDTIKEALELGIIDYVPKPFTPSVLLDVTERAAEWIKGRKPEEKKVTEEFPPAMEAELERVINELRRKQGALIPVLQRAQEIVGYLPPVVQKKISKGLNIPVAEVHSVVSFYSFFTMKPRGDHNIRVCLGTACYVRGIERVLSKIKDALKIDIGDTTENRKFSLEGVRCLGACGLAPVMVIDQETHGAMTPKKAIGIISQYDPAFAEAATTEAVEEEMAEKED
ncbi:MAG: NAD(P)H-dependent oxidoreductase subunit E [Thermodesulfovibrionales bacterium]|nr:NAD(P)H-dependent oxidoreductase subunit E [Thermodesulfovibrionales bacterium]